MSRDQLALGQNFSATMLGKTAAEASLFIVISLYKQ
jgi:hypothetical protein